MNQIPQKVETADGQLFKLVTKQKHVFGVTKRIFINGGEQIERTCQHCGLVRITVCRGNHIGREYRWFNSAQFTDDTEPECVGDVPAARATT